MRKCLNRMGICLLVAAVVWMVMLVADRQKLREELIRLVIAISYRSIMAASEICVWLVLSAKFAPRNKVATMHSIAMQLHRQVKTVALVLRNRSREENNLRNYATSIS